MLFEEASKLYLSMTPEEVRVFVTLEDYKFYWKRVKEQISSSYSGLHIGHYKAAAYNDDLAMLHYMKLNEMARRGLPLKRWGKESQCYLKR